MHGASRVGLSIRRERHGREMDDRIWLPGQGLGDGIGARHVQCFVARRGDRVACLGQLALEATTDEPVTAGQEDAQGLRSVARPARSWRRPCPRLPIGSARGRRRPSSRPAPRSRPWAPSPVPPWPWLASPTQVVDLGRPDERRVERDVVAVVEARRGRRRSRSSSRTRVSTPVAIDVVAGLILLEHQPHRAHVVAGEAPVARGVQVAQAQLGRQAELDAGDAVASPCGSRTPGRGAATRG